MHQDFGEWYRLASIEPTDDVLRKRWAGIEDWVSAMRDDDDSLLETVRIFRSLPGRSSREAYLAAFSKHDSAFSKRQNELEQRVLAGAALVECVRARRAEEEGNEEVAPRAAVLVGSAIEATGLYVSDDLLEELAGEVLAGLHSMARTQRKRSGFDATLLRSGEQEALTGTLEKLSSAPDHGQLRTQTLAALQILLKAVHRSESALEGAAHDLRCADEESNILWWLAGGSSRDLDKPWTALLQAAPIVAGWELSDLTDVALGPHDAAALLERVLSDSEGKGVEQPIEVFVNAVPTEWATARAAALPERALDLAPLSLALWLRSKSDASTWQAFFEKISGLNVSTALSPERVARLAYVEAVLLSTIVNRRR